MPKRVWLYLTALLYYRTSATCVVLAEALQTVSHDRLTRMLQADWSGQRLLESACRTLFIWERGYLIIDDTVVPKPFATAMEGLAWVFSSQERKPVYGFSLVLLVWTDGSVRIPFGIRLWRQWDASKYALALELLSYARNRLRCHPAYVLFDAWYPSKALLKRIRDYGVKGLAGLIRKGGMQLEGKVVVARKSFVSKEPAVNREKVCVVEVKDPRPGGGLGERKGQHSAPIDVWHVVVPLRKGRAVGNRPAPGVATKIGFLSGGKVDPTSPVTKPEKMPPSKSGWAIWKSRTVALIV
jgi:hypothetical protein